MKQLGSHCRALALLTGLAALPVFSQQPRPQLKHPGDTIRYEVRFTGPDAARIKSASMWVNLMTAPIPGQVNFQDNIRSADAAPGKDGVFRLEVKVPPAMASGDYAVNFYAFTETGARVGYDHLETSTAPIHIDDSLTFHKPQIVVTPR